MTTLITKNSSTASAVPTTSDLVQGELAVNVTDKRAFTKNASGTVVELGTNPSSLTLSGGTSNGVAYLNGSKVLTTGSALTYSGGIFQVAPGAGSAGYAAFAGNASADPLYVGQDSAGLARMFLAGNNPITFWTSATERARIDSSGNLLVGTTSATANDSQSFAVNKQGSSATLQVNHNTGAGNAFAAFNYAAGTIGSITQNGTTGVLYNLTSDYRLKNNPTPVTGAKEFVMALQPKTWDWWDGSGKGVGFIAHEFMEVAKYSGMGEKDAVDENGKPVYQSIQPSSSEVMANLVALIQEQQNLIQQLQAQLTSVSVDVAALKGN